MGASQSQPSRPPSARSRSRSRQSAGRAQPQTIPPPTSTSSSTPEPSPTPSRLSSFRRLSLFGRRESNKRTRTLSSGDSDTEQKKRRVGADNGDDQPPAEPSHSIAGPSIIPALGIPVQTAATPPSTIPTALPTPQAAAATSPDPLLADRLRTLSAIRDTLGPTWPAASPTNAAIAQERIRNLRQSLPETPPVRPPLESRLSDRVYSFLRIPPTGTGTTPPLTTAGTSATTPGENDSSIEELTRQLEQARADLADSRRQLEEMENGIAAGQATGGAGGDATSAPAGNPQLTSQGALLVIQGLAQTSAVGRGAGETPSAFASRMARAAVPRRSSSEGSTNDRSSSTAGRASLDDQARMISSLLTVAAAATATTLLAPDDILNAGAPPPSTNFLSSFVDRFRNQRRSESNVETALGNYLRTALRERWGDESNQGVSGRSNYQSSVPMAPSSVFSTEFQGFLESIQSDVNGAVHAFAGAGDSTEETASGDAASTLSERPTTEATESTASAAATEPTSTAEAATTEEVTDSSNIPSFHYQRGQTLPDDPRRRYGVTGGQDGIPRRLNLFRAHVFPPVRDGQPGTRTGVDDPNGMVPCIFVGVRSIAANAGGDEEGFGADLAAETNPTTGEASDGEGDGDRPPTPMPAPASANPNRRSLRERVMDRLSSNWVDTRPRTPVNTFAVVVIGGYYPRSHPLLSIPSLLSGGPLTDEEMALVSELMGQGKPPTATREEIEQSGLAVVDGSQIAELVADGTVLENCLERCLVCLGDYETGEECRVLKCRHAYHKDCVDQWLSKGRNSCPACRSEAVETKGDDTNGAAAAMGMEEPTPA